MSSTRAESPSTSRPAEPPVERIQIEVSDLHTTHRNVVVGVTLLTILTLFSVFFSIGIGVAATANPPEAGWT